MGFQGHVQGKKKILKISALDNELPRLPWQTLLKGLQGKIGRDRGAHKQVIIVQIFRRPHVLIPPILEPEGKSRHWAMVMIIGVHHIDCPGKQGRQRQKDRKNSLRNRLGTECLPLSEIRIDKPAHAR